MNRFVVIVLADRREDSDAVVSAVSALGQDKDAEQATAMSQLAGEREYAVAAAAKSAAAWAHAEDRRGVGFLKLKDKLGPGEEKIISARRARPFTATSLQVDSECAPHFFIVDIRYSVPGMLGTKKSVEFRADTNPVPAAVFSDEGVGGPLFDFECSDIEITVKNMSKKAHVFRAQLLGFQRMDGTPVSLGAARQRRSRIGEAPLPGDDFEITAAAAGDGLPGGDGAVYPYGINTSLFSR